VEVLEWIGDTDHFSELKDVWLDLEGIPPKWCHWKVFAHITSSFGILREVDWSTLFKSFYASVRVKISCRSPSKIPSVRLYEMDKKLYMIVIIAEGYEKHVAEDKTDNGDDQDDDDEGANDDDFDDLDDFQDDMEIDRRHDADGSKANTLGLGQRHDVGDKSDGGENDDIQSPGSIAQLYTENLQQQVDSSRGDSD
jgi:hypothetical protein